MKCLHGLAVGLGTAGASLFALLGLGVFVPTAAAAPPLARIAAAIPAQTGTGTIKGRAVYGGATAPKPKVLAPQGANIRDAAVCAAKPVLDQSLIVDPATKGIPFAFAYLPKPQGQNPEAQQAILDRGPVEIDQQGCEFVPHNVAVLAGQPLVFKSSDPVPHNVHYQGFNNAQNISLPPFGKLEVDQLQPERRAIPLVCDIHPWMKGYMMIFDHPFYAVTGQDGSFTIEGVPAGPQNIVVWQEAVGYLSKGGLRGQPVTVKAGEIVDLGDIVLDPSRLQP